MLDSETRRRIDNARDILVGKVPDPKSQVEQITIALIYKFMDDMDKDSIEMGGKAKFFTGEFEKYAWSKMFNPKLGGMETMTLYSEAIIKMNVNPNIPQLFRDIFKNAFLPYRDPETLKSFLKEINEFNYDHSERLGDAFEYLLSVLGSQGSAGQFRTPRHIIDFIVEVVDPQKSETILDPACGTAGFLISSYKHILKQNTKDRKGDQLKTEERKRLLTNFVGYDISPDMVRLSLVNMYLHGFPQPQIHEYDTLTSEERWNEKYDVILANPPFMSPKGGIRPHKKFAIQAKRSEVLFVDYISEHLNVHGRAGVIVPEGVIFQSQTAYKNLRKMLVDDNYLYAVVSLPPGVFQPYSGVKTSVLLMDRSLAKKTDHILFVKIRNDGYDLGAQRKAIDKNDLPQALDILKKYKASLQDGKVHELEEAEKELAHVVEKKKIGESGDWNLSGERYRVNIRLKKSNFKLEKLGEVAKLYNGRAYKAEELLKEGKTPVLRVGNLFSEKEWYFSNLDLEENKYCQDGDLIYAWSASFGPFIWKGPKVIYHYHIWKIECTSEIVKKFLYWILHKETEKIKEQSHGIAMLHITKSKMEQLEIPIPPISVQKEIVAEIEGYQKIIDGAKQVVENWLPRIEVDESWETAKLGDFCRLMTGGTPNSKKKEYYEGGNIKWIVSGDIHQGEIYDCEKRITRTGLENSNAKLLPINSVLIALNGQGKTRGTVAMLRTEASCNQSIVSIDPIDKSIAKAEFIYFVLKGLYQNIRNITGDKERSGLNMKLISNIEIPIAPISIQETIIEQVYTEQKIVNDNKKLIEIYENKIRSKIANIWD